MASNDKHVGAAGGWQVLLYGSFDAAEGPDAHALSVIIKAGGGTIVKQTTAQQVHLAVMAPSQELTARVRNLLSAGVACASPAYVVEWLAFPGKHLSTHLLFGSKAGSELLAAQRARCKL